MKMRGALFLLISFAMVVGLSASDTSSDESVLNDTKSPKLVNTLQGEFGFKNISDTIKPAFWPALAVNNRDELMVVFAEEFAGGEIFSTMSKDGGATWSTPNKTESIVFAPKALDVVDDPEGNFHMVFADGTSSALREIYYRYYKNGTWQPREKVSSSIGNAQWAHIDVEGDMVYIAWYEELGGDNLPVIHMKEKKIGEAWPAEPENASQDPSNGFLYPDIKVKHGNVHLVFQVHVYSGGDVATKVIAFKERVGSVWQPSVDLSPWAWPDLEVDDLGYVHALFPNKGKVLYRGRHLNKTWSAAVNLASRDGIDGFFDLDSRSGTLVAAYMSEASRNSEYSSVYIRVKKYENGDWGNWGEEIEVDPGGTPDLPKVILDSEGYAHVVWVDWSSTVERLPDTVYYDKFKVGEPDAPFMVLNKYSLDFRAPQGEPAETQSFEIRNGGPETLDFEVSADEWITVTPLSGTVGEDWMEIFVDVDTELDEGEYEGEITITSEGATNSPQTVEVTLKVDPPPIFEPLNFMVERKENKTAFYKEVIHVLGWEPNPENKDISKYLITREYEDSGVTTTQKFEVNSGSFEYIVRNVTSGISYTYSIQAVDIKDRLGPPAVFTIEE